MIKPNRSGTPLSGDILPSGSIIVRGITLKSLLAGAWRVSGFAVFGGPGWLHSDRFDVVAKASPGAPPDQIQAMIRRLLTESFHLKLHTEERVVSFYALPAPAPKPQAAAPDPPYVGCRGNRVNGEARRACYSVNMVMFAVIIASVSPNYIDLPAVDETGLNLDRKKEPRPAVIIDHVDRMPDGN